MPYWLDLKILHYVAVNKNIFINQRFNFKLKNILNNKLMAKSGLTCWGTARWSIRPADYVTRNDWYDR